MLSYFAVLIFAFTPPWARAGGDEVVVVYNSRLPESKAVADYYAKARQVPPKQVFGFALTTNEVMSRAEFADSLQLPLAKKLESEGLWKFARTVLPVTNNQPARIVRRVAVSKIRYAVLCWGVPLKIADDPSLREAGVTNLPPEFRRNDASVDSELAWLPLLEMKPNLTGPLPNWTYGTTNTSWLTPTNGILLVARLDGPTADIARGLVDKSLQAEHDGLWGRAYFDTRGFSPADSNLYLGDDWILGAAQVARILGFETVMDTNPATFSMDFPMSQIAVYAGWYADNADGPFAVPKVEFMPGAFAYHLHSFSAATLRSPKEHWCGPLLAKGATCTMGCVNEPYLILTPNVAMFLARWSISQFTFGEAAWATQPALSWQTTVIGDPLYRPFGKEPQALQDEFMRNHSPLIEWSYLRVVNAELLRGAPPPQVVNFLENLSATTNSAVLTEKLADLYELQGKPTSAIDTWELALTRNPSPEQRIRLRLTLADRFLALNRQKDAYADLWKILDENPDYPVKFHILKRVLNLAISIGDKDEITRSVNAMQKFGAENGGPPQ